MYIYTNILIHVYGERILIRGPESSDPKGRTCTTSRTERVGSSATLTLLVGTYSPYTCIYMYLSLYKVNLLNTFKFKGQGNTFCSSVIRWFWCRFKELAAAIESWISATDFASALTASRHLRDLLRASVRKGRVRSPFGSLPTSMGLRSSTKKTNTSRSLANNVVVSIDTGMSGS